MGTHKLGKNPENLAQRTIASISWNFVGNSAQIGIAFVRSVLLARLLPIEVFGIYSWAHSITTLTGILPDFGLGGAFVYRAAETEDEDQAAATQFTLQLILTLIWIGGLAISNLCFTPDPNRRIALLWVAVMATGSQLTRTARLILTRRVVHRRLALIQLVDTIISSIVAIFLAWQGATLWALLATDLVTCLVNIIGFYIWRPVWKPRLQWNPKAIRYFLSFGGRNVTAIALLRALDRLDDLWVASYLGNVATGLYSRAYQFATYPRKILASPVNMVAGGTYAELTTDRKRLSQAFYRTNALLIRSGFLIAGLLALIAPELIRLLLGDKWEPMLDAFRLMLIYTMFDPFKLTIASVFIAVGKPEKVAQIRAIQLITLIIGLFILGPSLEIAGVALAVDAMLIVGIILLLWQARVYVDFSITKLFIAPAIALVSAMLTTYWGISLPEIAGSDWRTGFVKTSIFLAVYILILFGLERKQMLAMLPTITKMLGLKRKLKTNQKNV